ncbi:MAG TPA: sigma-70 family RNA polymerase sigma factor, partial [Bacteroidales bacterium]|nr:sigma-70 family RNA polymerase sigma factor [Bacteroidales bacterium]
MDQLREDSELIKKLQKGDVEAFDLIYEKYAGKLYLFGLKYLRTSADAEELVQSVFLKIWENHKQLNKELSFKSYLFTIAYNDICKLFRKRKYMQKFIT